MGLRWLWRFWLNRPVPLGEAIEEARWRTPRLATVARLGQLEERQIEQYHARLLLRHCRILDRHGRRLPSASKAGVAFSPDFSGMAYMLDAEERVGKRFGLHVTARDLKRYIERAAVLFAPATPWWARAPKSPFDSHPPE